MRKQAVDCNDPKVFDIEIDDQVAQVNVHQIKSVKVYQLTFVGRRKPLNITVASNQDGERFWTSIPEGRQQEAELAGKAIAAYLREYRRTSLCVTITDKKLATPSLFD